jgi:regulator of sirC expression with transglutaminase-like and TPR domain
MSETLVAREMANRSQLREALRFSDHAIQTLPDSPYGHYVHAVILAKLGQPRTAIEELELARGLALKQPTKVASIPVIDQSLLELRNILQAN